LIAVSVRLRRLSRRSSRSIRRPGFWLSLCVGLSALNRLRYLIRFRTDNILFLGSPITGFVGAFRLLRSGLLVADIVCWLVWSLPLRLIYPNT
jgi:hypothetical protein